jgi:hypothetical protein
LLAKEGIGSSLRLWGDLDAEQRWAALRGPDLDLHGSWSGLDGVQKVVQEPPALGFHILDRLLPYRDSFAFPETDPYLAASRIEHPHHLAPNAGQVFERIPPFEL